MKNWHTLSIESVCTELESSVQGLSAKEADRRLAEFGKNEFHKRARATLVSVFLSQFKSPLIYVLVAAGMLLGFLGEFADAVVIAIVLLANAGIGSYQEYKAENTYTGLQKLLATSSTVLRGGRRLVVASELLVPGDIIIVREGERIPADARVVEGSGLLLNEAALTGESLPVPKTFEPIEGEDLLPAERSNMLWAGTTLLSGHGMAIVVSTGIATEVGKISERVQGIDTEIPLRADIRKLSRSIIVLVVALLLLLFVFGVYRGLEYREMFAVVVSLAVSVIPEGLPVVLTVVLVSGVERMARSQALVKRLQAVEALGQATVLALDKTGTLTKNELVVREVITPSGSRYVVTGDGYDARGEIRRSGDGRAQHSGESAQDELSRLGLLAALCSNADVSFSEATHTYVVSGDPTEAALGIFARKVGTGPEQALESYPILQDIPFDYARKFHGTLHKGSTKNLFVVFGAPEQLVPNRMEEVHQLATRGFRVLAALVAEVQQQSVDPAHLPPLTFAGFLALGDTLRPEAKHAVRRVISAGLRVVMITGDNPVTARAIAEEVGIWSTGDRVVTGVELDELSDAELEAAFSSTSVFARVTPEHKLRIIEIYRSRGDIVAMTGDGVNDAPSLVAADLGIAMGKIGTEVAKEASDIVLLDDNFGSIVAAAHEGREIYRRIRRVLLYLFSTNVGEVITVAGALVVGLPLPLLASQIIWLNLVTDGFLVIPLALDPRSDQFLDSRRTRSRSLVDGTMLRRMLVMAPVMGIGTLALFSAYQEIDPSKAITVSMTTLAVFQWCNAWNCRHSMRSVFSSGPRNRNLYLALLAVVMLQLAALYTEPLATLLRAVPLSVVDWVGILIVASSVIWAEEVRKWIVRFYRRDEVLVQ